MERLKKAVKENDMATYVYKTKAEALREAKKHKRAGHRVHVHRDPLTGKWIVTILFLGLALGVLGAALRPR